MPNFELAADTVTQAGRFIIESVEAGSISLRQATELSRGMTDGTQLLFQDKLPRLSLVGKPTAEEIGDLSWFLRTGNFHPASRIKSAAGAATAEELVGMSGKGAEVLERGLQSGHVEDEQGRLVHAFAQPFDTSVYRNATAAHRLWLASDFTHQQPLSVEGPNKTMITTRFGEALNSRAAEFERYLSTDKIEPLNRYFTNHFERSSMASVLASVSKIASLHRLSIHLS